MPARVHPTNPPNRPVVSSAAAAATTDDKSCDRPSRRDSAKLEPYLLGWNGTRHFEEDTWKMPVWKKMTTNQPPPETILQSFQSQSCVCPPSDNHPLSATIRLDYPRKNGLSDRGREKKLSKVSLTHTHCLFGRSCAGVLNSPQSGFGYFSMLSKMTNISFLGIWVTVTIDRWIAH